MILKGNKMLRVSVNKVCHMLLKEKKISLSTKIIKFKKLGNINIFVKGIDPLSLD